VRSITKIEKKKFGFIQNCIKIEAKDGTKMQLASLTKRDAVYDFLRIIWTTTMDPAFSRSQVAIKEHLQDLGDEDSGEEGGETQAPQPKVRTHEPLLKRTSAVVIRTSPETTQGRKRSDSASSIDGMKEKDREGAKQDGELRPSNTDIIHALNLEKGDATATKPERIFRNNSLRGQAPAPAIPAIPDQSHRQRVVQLAKQKSKKGDKEDQRADAKDRAWVVLDEPLISQKTLLSELFTGGAQEVYDFVFYSSVYLGKFTRRKDIHQGPWELRDGAKVRVITFTNTIKLPARSTFFQSAAIPREPNN